jgi:hypothetical protein
LIGAGLPNVRYDPVPITFRTASKRRDGPEANILLVNYRTYILPRIQLFEEAPHQNSDNHDRQYEYIQWEQQKHRDDDHGHLPSARGLRESDKIFQRYGQSPTWSA